MVNPKVSQEKFLEDIWNGFTSPDFDGKLYTYLVAFKHTKEHPKGIPTDKVSLDENFTQSDLNAFCHKNRGNSIYFSLNLSDIDISTRPKQKRVKASEVICGRALCMDVDVAGPGHSDANLFPTKKEAEKWIEELPLKYNYLVDSGGGYQVYWLLQETEPIAVISELEAGILAYCGSKTQYKLDAVGSAEHIFRLPWTSNCKIPGKPRPCKIVGYNEGDYTADEVKGGFKVVDTPKGLADLPTPAVGLSIDQLRAEIMQIKFSDSFSYDDWLHVLMGLHHETGGSEEGLNLAHEWSQTDQRSDGKGGELADDLKGIVDKWVSFGKEERDKVRTWSGVRYDHKIKPTGIEDLESIADLVACAEQFDFSDRAVEAIMKRGAELKIKTDLRNAIKKAQKLHIAKDRISDTMYYFKEGRGGVCTLCEDGWMLSTAQAVNIAIGGGSVLQDAVNAGIIQSVDKLRYTPGKSNVYTDALGKKTLNFCKPWPMDVDVEIDPLTHARFIGHLKDSMGEDWRVAMDWMAYIYQNPGHRVGWCPVISGDQGTGKSTIVDMFGRALGRGNATTIPGDALLEDFNGWVARAFVAVEEISLYSGYQTAKAYNKMKELIGTPKVNWHRKGIERVEIENVANFILLSNDTGCLPFAQEQRRFAPIIMKNKGWDLDYFEAVFGPFGCYQDVDGDINLFRRMLLDHQISAEFKPGKAPITEATPTSKEDSLSETAQQLQLYLEKKARVTLLEAREYLVRYPDVKRSNRAVKTALLELGWIRIDDGHRFCHYEPEKPRLTLVEKDDFDFSEK